MINLSNLSRVLRNLRLLMNMSSVFTFTHSVHSKCTRSQPHKITTYWKTNFGKKAFHYRATKLWSELPPNIRVNFNKMSVNQLKILLYYPGYIILCNVHVQQMYNKMLLKSVYPGVYTIIIFYIS